MPPSRPGSADAERIRRRRRGTGWPCGTPQMPRRGVVGRSPGAGGRPGHQSKACAVRCLPKRLGRIGAVHHSHHVTAGQDTLPRSAGTGAYTVVLGGRDHLIPDHQGLPVHRPVQSGTPPPARCRRVTLAGQHRTARCRDDRSANRPDRPRRERPIPAGDCSIVANTELQERELIKFAALSAALADTCAGAAPQTRPRA
jgi:hypothetical protein